MNGRQVKRPFLPKILLTSALFLLSLTSLANAQDWVKTGTNLGVQRIRLAAADFKAATADPQTAPLKTVFDQTLYNDLKNAGIFDMVSKSMAPPQTPGTPQEINLSAWAAAPSSAEMVAFGALSVSGGQENRHRIPFRYQESAESADSGQAVQQCGYGRKYAADRAPLRRRNHPAPRRGHQRHL